MVKSGMRSVELGSTEDTYSEYLLSPESSEEEISIINHDIRELASYQGYLWVGTRLGVTVIDFENGISNDYDLPQGHDLNDMILLDNAIVMLTEYGVWIANHDEGMLEDILDWDYEPGKFTAGDILNRDGENSHIVALGAYGFGKVIEIDSFGDIGSVWDIGEGIRNVMTEGNATATVVQHVGVPAGPLTLFVGTDVGLFKVETASARDSATPNWIFYQSPEPTSVASNFDQLRSLGTQGTGNPATVNA